MPSYHLILCHPLLLLPSVFPSIRVFSNESCLSGGQSIGALASVLPMNIHGWFSLLLTGLISLQSKRLSSVFSSTIIQKHQENIKLWHSAFFMVQLSHLCITPEKTAALTMQTFVSIVVSLLFNMLSRLVMAFLLRSKHLLISWLQSPSTVVLEPEKIKSVTVSIVSPSICHEVMDPDAMILVIWMLSFEQAFSLFSLTLIKLASSSSAFCH